MKEIGPVLNAAMWTSALELFAIVEDVVLPDHQLILWVAYISLEWLQSIYIPLLCHSFFFFFFYFINRTIKKFANHVESGI